MISERKNMPTYMPGCEMYFAVNLQCLRRSVPYGMTQGRLAEKLGVTRNTYAGYESGKRMPPAWFVHCAAEYFGVTADEMVGEKLGKEQIKNANVTSFDPASDRKREKQYDR